MALDETMAPAPQSDAPVRRRDLAVARSLDSARMRSENRVQRFLDAGFELLASAESGRDFTVQDVVERSGQSLRSFYQYFAGKHELLLALFDEAIRSTADEVRQEVEDESGARERLHRFVVAYYLRCMPAVNGRSSKNHPTPVMAEFCHQLLTAHQAEASRAFVPLVDLLDEVIRDGVAAGVVCTDREERDMAGAVLSTIMFNAAYAATISGSPEPADRERAAEQMWEFVSSGIVVEDHSD
jgi:AcrR family transcriptional regulator